MRYFQRMVKLTEHVDRVGASIRYADLGGAGRPVVFIHGAGVDHAMFDPQARAVAEAGHRVVTGDLRGHGESRLRDGERFTASDALDDLAALLDRLDADRPVLVGHSLGGNLAQELVRRMPDRAGGLVVVDSTWNAGPLSGSERFGLRIAAPVLAMIPAKRLPGMMARASATTPDAIAYAERCFATMPKSRFLDVWRATASLVHPAPSYRTPVPLALIRGEEDRTGNIASAMPRWAAAEGLTEQRVPRAGHLAPLDAPGAVSTALLEFLAALEPVAGEGRDA